MAGSIISLDERRREREQRRITPQLQQAAKLRRIARLLMLEAEVIEAEAYGTVDYDTMAAEKVENLETLHNA